MDSPAARRWSCPLLGALLALLAADLFAPPARAGCGSHVLIGNPDPRTGPQRPAPGPKPAPCSGPHCSKAPATPAPAPVSLPAPAEQQWASVPGAPELPGPAPFGMLAEKTLVQPVRGGADVYHPPR